MDERAQGCAGAVVSCHWNGVKAALRTTFTPFYNLHVTAYLYGSLSDESREPGLRSPPARACKATSVAFVHRSRGVYADGTAIIMKPIHTERHRSRHPAVFAWLRLARVFQKIDTHSERLFRTYGLNRAQFDVLAHVGAARSMTQQQLADALVVTKGNISQLLCKMEQDGLIARCHAGRTNYLSLTEDGQALFQRVVPQQEAQLTTLLASLSNAEQLELLRLLRKLDRSIETHKAV